MTVSLHRRSRHTRPRLGWSWTTKRLLPTLGLDLFLGFGVGSEGTYADEDTLRKVCQKWNGFVLYCTLIPKPCIDVLGK